MTVSFCLKFDQISYLITTDEYQLGISCQVMCFSPIGGQGLGETHTDRLNCLIIAVHLCTQKWPDMFNCLIGSDCQDLDLCEVKIKTRKQSINTNKHRSIT